MQAKEEQEKGTGDATSRAGMGFWQSPVSLLATPGGNRAVRYVAQKRS
jgi:hypothetical protein